jgi:hypothetical protein
MLCICEFARVRERGQGREARMEGRDGGRRNERA